MTGSLISVFMLEVRQIIAGKKLLVVALLLAAAAALAFIVRRFAPDSEPGWPVIYMFMMTFLYLHTLVILVPLLFMTALIREETDEGTLVYLVTRPVAKPMLLLTKFAAAAAVSATLIALGMVLFHAAYTLPGKAGAGDFDWAGRLSAFLRAGVLGVIGYGALFTLAGVLMRRALIFGIAYGFLSELILSMFPAVIQKTTIMFYLRSTGLSGSGSWADRELDAALSLLDLASPLRSAIVVLGASAAFLAMSCVVVSVREFVESRGAEAT